VTLRRRLAGVACCCVPLATGLVDRFALRSGAAGDPFLTAGALLAVSSLSLLVPPKRRGSS
jgi:hypothetical protein